MTNVEKGPKFSIEVEDHGTHLQILDNDGELHRVSYSVQFVIHTPAGDIEFEVRRSGGATIRGPAGSDNTWTADFQDSTPEAG